MSKSKGPITRSFRTGFNWLLKPGNIEDLTAQLKQLEEFDWRSLPEESDRARFLALRTIAKPELVAEIRWAELVQRSPWVRPLRVFFLWGVLVVPLVIFLIARGISAIAQLFIS